MPQDGFSTFHGMERGSQVKSQLQGKATQFRNPFPAGAPRLLKIRKQ
jgi:hypothetical protein